MMLRFIAVLFALGFLTSLAPARVLLLSHFDNNLDADHSLYGEPKATADGLTLTAAPGSGKDFKDIPPGKALDAGYSNPSNGKACITYSSANLSSRGGTIDMWVKPAYTADPERALKQDIFRTLITAPLGTTPGTTDASFLSLYYAYYQWVSYTPVLMFQIHVNGVDYIATARLASDEKGNGVPWEKDRWYFLTATWTPTKVRVFINGKLAAEATPEKPIDLPPVSGPIVIGNDFRYERLARALIDDLRICDAPLYGNDKEIPLPTAPLASADDSKIVQAGSFGVLYQPDPREYACYLTDRPPTIDGKLDDAIWQRIPAMSGFLQWNKVKEYDPVQTSVRVCRDDKNIYFAITLYEPELAKIKADAKAEEPGKESYAVFGDDDTEIFLGPTHGKLPNVQIGINSINTRADILHSEGKADAKWNGTYKTATGKTEKAWVVEMAFPYADLGVSTPNLGDKWGLRVGRNRHVGGAFISSINYGTSAFQLPEQFLRLIMAGAVPQLEVAKEEARLNQEYIQSCRDALEKFLRESKAQLAFGDEVPADVKAKFAITPLEASVRAAQDATSTLLGKDSVAPIERWDLAFLDLQTQAATLEKLGYNLANAGSVRAALPEKSFKGIGEANGLWFLASDQIAAAIEPKHGMLVGVWDRAKGQQIVVNSYLLYQGQTKTVDINTDERTDIVTSIKAEGDRLVVESHNAKLPGVTFKKSFFLEKVGDETRSLARRLEIAGSVPEMTLVQVSTRTLFDEGYRKPSNYSRIFVIGTLGDGRSCVPASEITGRVQQRGWFNSDESRAQFVLANPATGSGLAEFLYKENDEWAYPQAMPSGYWTPFGWDMGFAAVFVGDPAYKDKPYSAEVRYQLFHGDRLAFHREYLALPEGLKVRTDHPPLAKASKIAGPSYVILNQFLGNSPLAKRVLEYRATSENDLWRPDELRIGTCAQSDCRWPDFPVGDDQDIYDVHRENVGVYTYHARASEVRDVIKTFQASSKQMLVQVYDWILDIYKGGQTYKNHPEFVRIGRDGRPFPGMVGSAFVWANWSPEFRNYLLEGFRRGTEYFNLDTRYIDYGLITFPDWGRGHVVTLAEEFDFFHRLGDELHAQNKLLYINGFAGQPYLDISYCEGLGTKMWGPTWRDFAEIWMTSKIYQRPGVPVIPLYWHGGPMYKEQGISDETIYLDKTVGSGLMPFACYLDPYEKNFPGGPDGSADWNAVMKYQIAIHHASFEMRDSQWADVGLANPWWNDPNSTLEAYTLRVPRTETQTDSAGAAYLINVLSHESSLTDKHIILDLSAMKFDPSKRTFVWQMLRRDYDKYPVGTPVPSNWNELLGGKRCTSVVTGKNQLEYTIAQLPPDRLCVTQVTQTPGAIASAAAIDTQLLLPTTLGARISGDVDESAKRVTLKVNCDKDVEVIAWWPKAWGDAKVSASGADVASKPVAYGDESFIRFPLKSGSHDVVVSGVK